MVWLLVIACASRDANGPGLQRYAAAMARGDQHFAARQLAEELDLAIASYGEALGEMPEDPVALARLTRAHAERGLGFPDPQRDDLATAKELGVRCMLTSPSFAGRAESADIFTERSLRGLTAEDAPCMTWTAIAWARWLEARGVEGAAIDLAPLTELARKVHQLAPQYEGGRPAAVLGLVLAFPPVQLGPDVEAGARLLEEERKRHEAKVDLALYVDAWRGDEVSWRRRLELVVADEGPWPADQVLLNEHAKRRARAALEQGFDARGRRLEIPRPTTSGQDSSEAPE